MTGDRAYALMSVIDGRYAYIVHVNAELITWARDETETWPTG